MVMANSIISLKHASKITTRSPKADTATQRMNMSVFISKNLPQKLDSLLLSS